MPDTDKPGAPDEAAAGFKSPVAAEPESASQAHANEDSQSTTPTTTTIEPPTPPPAPSIGAFGTTRGSGLSRGKRAVVSAPVPVGTSPQPAYKPSALEMITPVSAYKNPFTGETSVGAPPASEPAPQAEDTPAHDGSAVESAPGVQIETVPDAEALKSAPESAEAAGTTGLKILPPEPASRPAVHWESHKPEGSGHGDHPVGRRGEGHDFPSRERREPRTFEPREGRGYREGGRDPRFGRDRRQGSRRDERGFEPRSHEPYQKESVSAKKPGGFMGWLKGLFGSPPEAVQPETVRPQEGRRDGGERRHRGGRGRGGQGRDFRDENRGQRGEAHQSRSGGYQGDDGGHRRRRRRGGRGRHHERVGDGGDRGPRPEGQQGGGAI